MDFQRINKNTVQCRMTEEEMNEYGFQIEDFFSPNQEKSRAFLERIVERAEEEIGYEVEGGMVSMQLMRMPDNSISITFTDRGEDGLQNMLHHLQNLASMIDENTTDEIIKSLGYNEDSQNTSEEASTSETSQKTEALQKQNNVNKEQKEAYKQHLKEIERKKRDKAKKEAASNKIYRFTSLHNIEKFAATITLKKAIPSKLYKDNATGLFYLLVKKGKLKFNEYQELCAHMSEYADLCLNQPHAEQYCKEHFDCIIAKQALKILKEY